KHAKTSQAKVSLEEINGEIFLIITDNGVGFDYFSYKKEKSWGLLFMKERVEGINGSFNLESEIGKGTKIEIRLRR
ncbi:MAG: hypothetical protein HQK78_19780, partial [Desulfobacterales bacterium]|nr:hypothetical protein [Desulfobacterales bacterium]